MSESYFTKMVVCYSQFSIIGGRKNCHTEAFKLSVLNEILEGSLLLYLLIIYWFILYAPDFLELSRAIYAYLNKFSLGVNVGASIILRIFAYFPALLEY